MLSTVASFPQRNGLSILVNKGLRHFHLVQLHFHPKQSNTACMLPNHLKPMSTQPPLATDCDNFAPQWIDCYDNTPQLNTCNRPSHWQCLVGAYTYKTNFRDHSLQIGKARVWLLPYHLVPREDYTSKQSRSGHTL